MEKISFLCFACLCFIGCASTRGGIQDDIIDGAANTDTAISKLQGQQASSTKNAAAITGTGTEIAGTIEDLASSIDTAVRQLAAGTTTDAEFAAVIQRVKDRSAVDYINTDGRNSSPKDATAKSKNPP